MVNGGAKVIKNNLGDGDCYIVMIKYNISIFETNSNLNINLL